MLKKKKKKNRKKRSSLNASNTSSGTVLANSLLLKNSASGICQLEAFGRHVSVISMPIKEKKPVLDYRKFANETITSSLKPYGKISSPKVFHKRRKAKEPTSELTPTSSSTPPASGKEHRKFIQKLHDKQLSIYGAAPRKVAPTGSASAECISPPRSQTVSQDAKLFQNRFLTLSAPADNNAQASRKIKIYLSDKNSKDTSECGQDFPCPPPASPAEGNLHDIREF